MKRVWLVLYNNETKKKFNKYFSTEYEKDKFKRKLQYSKKLKVIEDSTENKFNN